MSILENTMINNVKPIRDIVYEQLREAILKGELKPGERIIEKDYADRLNISRTPIREALRKLETEGFVEYIPRKGVVVKSFNVNDIKEIYEIRKVLECFAVRKAIENIDDSSMEKLKATVEQMYLLEEQGDIKGVFEICQEFNEVIFNATGMPRLVDIINTLKEFIERFRRVTMSKSYRRLEAIKEHKGIYEAIIERDIEKAEKLVYEHLTNSERVCLKEFDFK